MTKLSVQDVYHWVMHGLSLGKQCSGTRSYHYDGDDEKASPTNAAEKEEDVEEGVRRRRREDDQGGPEEEEGLLHVRGGSN